MNLALRMAWRNLWRHGRRTWLTTLAMVFSNVLLVFLISLQYGSYDLMIDNSLRAFSGHLQVQQVDFLDQGRMRETVPAARSLADRARATMDGAAIAARAEAWALASSDKRSFGIRVIGVEPAYEPGVSTLPGLLRSGRWLQAGNSAEIVIGSVMARNLQVQTGDELTLLGSGLDGSFAAGVATIVGVFDSGMAELDRGLAEVPLGWFQEVFAMGDAGHAVVVVSESLDAVPAQAEALRTLLPETGELVVRDWNELQPGLRQAILADLSSAWFMYGVLVILVAFSVMNTQLMSVLERTREFGVVLALGIRPRRLATLVVLETALMACLGFALGVALGALVAAWFHRHGFSYPGMEQMVERFNLPGRVFPSVTPFTLTIGPIVVFAFSCLAAIYPALRLFRLRPVTAMRAA